MTTTIEMIKRLREETGAGLFDCRLALEENNASYPAALQHLKEKIAEQAKKHTDRQASQGVLEVYAHGNGRIGVMVEINCETDFAAHSQPFRALAHEIALQIAAAAPLWLHEVDIPQEVLDKETEKIARRMHEEGKPEALLAQITAGHLKKFMNQRVLLRQSSIRDETLTVSQLLEQTSASLGENIMIRRFSRWELAETG